MMMTDDEVEVVAAELAKAGGLSWHSGQERGPVKLVMDRYRDRARLAIAALDRFCTARQGAATHSPETTQFAPSTRENRDPTSCNTVSTGSLVLYRPPGDNRTYPCRVEKVDGNHVYLVPDLATCTGWIDLKNLSSPAIK
jgi:hypothetical protein